MTSRVFFFFFLSRALYEPLVNFCAEIIVQLSQIPDHVATVKGTPIGEITCSNESHDLAKLKLIEQCLVSSLIKLTVNSERCRIGNVKILCFVHDRQMLLLFSNE